MRLRSYKSQFALALLVTLTLSTLIAPLFFSPEANIPHADLSLLSPSANYWCGTDALGRDLLYRILIGARTSLLLGFFCSSTAILISLCVGAVAAFLGGRAETLIIRSLEIGSSIPHIVIILLISNQLHKNFLTVSDFWIVVISISATNWFGLARNVRHLFRQTLAQPYVESAIVIGASPLRIAKNYILPEIAGPLFFIFAYQIPTNVIYEGILSFLGLGLRPPEVSWGVLIQEGWKVFSVYPHLVMFPCLGLFILMFAIQMLSSEVEKYFDPHQRGAERL